MWPHRPAYQDPKWNQRTNASTEFEYCFCREPVKGDLLRWEHVRVMRGPELNEAKFRAQIDAWERRLPQLSCPLKFEDGRLFKRQRDGEWFEAVDVSWSAHWWGVECDARSAPEEWAYGTCPELWSDPDPDPLARMPSIVAVTFLGVIEGKMACRVATEKEQRRPEEDQVFREVLCQAPKSDPPPGYSWVRGIRTDFYWAVPIEELPATTGVPNAQYTLHNNSRSPRKRSARTKEC